MVTSLESGDKILKRDHTKEYFAVRSCSILAGRLYQTFEYVDEILKCGREYYFL